MADQPWRKELGIIAVVIWSIMVGLPVFVFHLRAPWLMVGEHLHSAALFVASEILVFWVAARPRAANKKAVVVARAAIRNVTPAHPSPQSVWEAELVEIPSEKCSTSPIPSASKSTSLTVKLLIENYIGSSRPRQITIEPEGGRHTLLPGQNLELTATSLTVAPSFRIVESDLVTQILIERANCDVSIVISDSRDGRESPPHGPLVELNDGG